MSLPQPIPTPNCGNLAFPASCPLPSPPPLDGRGGPCYNIPFSIPTCDIWNGTFPTIRHNVHTHLTWAQIDEFYSYNAYHAVLVGFSLGLSVLTLLNVLVLTPGRKRGFLVHWAILGGLVGQVVRSSMAAWVRVDGAVVSAYLQLSRDWIGTEWSGLWRGLVTAQQVVGCLIVAAVHVAFWCQCRGLLVWVRIRYGRGVYRGVLGMLCGFGIISWLWRVAYAVYQIYYTAFATEQVLWPTLFSTFWWNVLSSGSFISAGISFGCWSMVFVVSAGWILWERKNMGLEVKIAIGRHEGKKRLRSVCERALNLIGFVGVESFLIPLVLSVLTAITRIPKVETLLVPVILTLLPLSSLLINGDESRNSPQQQENAAQLHLISNHEIAQHTHMQRNTHINAAKPEGLPADESVQRPELSVDTSVDRELLEIDRLQ